MDRIPLNRAGALGPVVDTLRRLGEPADALLRRARVSEAWLQANPEALMPNDCLYRVLDQAAREIGPAFGILAAGAPIASTGAFGRAIRRSVSVYDALRTFVKRGPGFGSLHRVWLREDPHRDAFWVCRSGPLAFEGGVAQAELMVFRYLIEIVRLAAGEHWKPQELRLRSGDAVVPALGDAEAFQGVSARLRQPWGGICVPRSITSLLMPAPAEQISDRSEVWPTPPVWTSFADSLRQLLMSLSTLRCDLSIEAAAEAAGLHPRALQRRLAQEDTDFRTVLAQARHLRARELLAEADLTLTEIAFELGYSDLAHFSRAYRRWAGAPPSAHRGGPERLGHGDR